VSNFSFTDIIKILDSDIDSTAWTWVNYVVFYYGVGFGNWNLGSVSCYGLFPIFGSIRLTICKSLIGIGLSWWQAIIAIFVSQMISSIAMYFNGRSGLAYNIGYPAVARSVFGMWGSYYFVPARAILSLIWLGVQSKIALCL
jgi:NCS1 family nucleobase:cation symporter-1